MADRPVRLLSLCAGVGGLELGVRMALPAARVVCVVEHEAFAAAVLAARMEEGRLDPCPVWTDLRTFDGGAWRGAVDLVVAGYPCQPFSSAGKRRGDEDPRHLWPHVLRVLRETRPELAFLENVRGHLSLGFDEVLADLHEAGFDAEWCLVRASDVGAPHRRERLFVLAHARRLADADCSRRERVGPEEYARAESRSRCGDVADPARGDGGVLLLAGGQEQADPHSDRAGRKAVGDPHGEGLQGRRKPLDGRPHQLPAWPPGPSDSDAWSRVLAVRPDLAPALKPPHGRVADELSDRLDRAMSNRTQRLRALGNAVVPAQAALAFATLLRRARDA